MRFLFAVVALANIILVDLPAPFAESLRPGRPAHHLRRGFQNLNPEYTYTMAGRARRLLFRSWEHVPDRGPVPTVLANDGQTLRANGQHPTVTWIGHSTFLVQIQEVNVLTDPHWGERASPVGFAGPRRLVPPGMKFEDLPPIHAVVISHDHYDHLDEATVTRLAREHRATFFVPLGIKAWLADAGVHDVIELDWWEAREFRGLVFTCTPAQHSSGRGLHDQNLRLRASWVISGPTRRFPSAVTTPSPSGIPTT